jgi:hypothetical protein
MAKNRRKVGGYIWDQQVNELVRLMEELRRLLNEIIRAASNHPVSTAVLLLCAAQMAQIVSTAISILHDMEGTTESSTEE